MKTEKTTRKLKAWNGPTTGGDDFIYIVAWLLMIPVMVFTIATTFGIGIVACVPAVLFLIGVRLLMKAVGYLKRIEGLLSGSEYEDESEIAKQTFASGIDELIDNIREQIIKDADDGLPCIAISESLDGHRGDGFGWIEFSPSGKQRRMRYAVRLDDHGEANPISWSAIEKADMPGHWKKLSDGGFRVFVIFSGDYAVLAQQQQEDNDAAGAC